MIDFKEDEIPSRGLRTLTAYISEVDLLLRGKEFLVHVIERLIKESVLLHRFELERIVSDYVTSQDTRKYIENKIREEIDKTIKEQIAEVFGKDDK